MEAKLKWAFKMYDINNDGRIDTTEMAKIIRVSCDARQTTDVADGNDLRLSSPDSPSDCMSPHEESVLFSLCVNL